MKNFQNRRPGGFSNGGKFGRQGGSWGRDERPSLHKAECASCGNVCEVPFKPNGRKPVYCSDCFRKEDNGGERSFERKSYAAPSYGEKRSFAPAAAACKCRDYSEELEMLNAKLDAVLGILTDAMGEEEGDEEDMDEVAEGETKE